MTGFILTNTDFSQKYIFHNWNPVDFLSDFSSSKTFALYRSKTIHNKNMSPSWTKIPMPIKRFMFNRSPQLNQIYIKFRRWKERAYITLKNVLPKWNKPGSKIE